MRFLFFAAQYLPTIGGVERYTSSLAAQLVTQGHTATVVTSALPGLPPDEYDSNGVHIIRLPAFLFLKGRLPVIKKNQKFRQMAHAIWAEPYDIAIINTRFYPLSLYAATQCKKRYIPAIVLEHGTAYLHLGSTFINTFVHLYERLALKYTVRQNVHFYGVSNACCAWLNTLGVKAEGVLYNAVSPSLLQQHSTTSKKDFRHQYNIATSAPLIVYSGRFIPEKGIIPLLSSYATIRNKYPNAKMILAGDGPLYEQIKQAAIEGVYLTGSLSYIDNLALLSQGDIFCLPTRSEGFSTVLLEAAALSCCIITTNVGGNPELVKNEENGLLIDSMDTNDIVQALNTLLATPSLYKQYAAMAQDTVQRNFTWQKTTEALLNATKILLEEPAL